MEVHILHSKSEILDFYKSSPELQIYCIGDLDNFFWPKTIWYALVEDSVIYSIALLYTGIDIPTLLLFYEKEKDYSYRLLEQIKTLLPNKFYAHLSEGLVELFGRQNILEYYGLSYKMALRETPEEISDKSIRRLQVTDLQKIKNFYALAYPDNWFDERMLETRKYFGYFEKEKLIGVSGIHVYSADYKVAALGNIATDPKYRGRQIAYKLTAKLCSDLNDSVEAIGLNVKVNNENAIKCYKKVGFEIIGTYDECFIKNTEGN